MKHRFPLYVLGLSIALSGVPPAMAQIPPGSSIPTVPTNLPNVRTFVAPPATFNPMVASPEALQQFGLPPKPDQLKAPAAYHAWAKAVTAPQRRLQSPQLVQTRIYNGPARLQPSRASKEAASEFNASPANAVATASPNWSGYVAYDNTAKPFAKSYIYAYWIVPVAQHAFGLGLPIGWDYSSQWVGIDGYGSPDILQAGTEVDAYLLGSTQGTFYAAWIEWYPLPSSRISNFAVAAGDEMFVEVWNTSATVGNAYLLNVTTQQAVSFTFTAPSGTTLVGDSAEWVVERPESSDGLAGC